MEFRLVRYKSDENGNGESICLVNKKNSIVACMKVEFQAGAVVVTYLAVSEHKRRQGFGTYLLQSYIDCISEADIFIPVEVYYTLGDDNGGLVPFFEAQENFDIIEKKSLYRISAKQRKSNKRWKRLKQVEWDAKEVFGKDRSIREKVRRELENSGFGSFMESDEVYDRQLSFAKFSDTGKLKATSLVKKHSDTEIELAFLYMVSNDIKALSDVVAATCNVMDELYSGAELWFNASVPEAAAFADSVFGSSSRAGGCYVATWNGTTDKDNANVRKMVNDLGLNV